MGKKEKFHLYKREGVEEITGVEGKTSICCGQGVSYKSYYSSHSNLHYELLQASKRANKRTRSPYKKILVGLHDDSRKVHWVSWERLSEAKEVGGMGFKEIEKFNDALLAKQVWRMLHNPDSLCFRVFKARFFPNYSILDAKESNSGSYAWKSILGARDVIKKGMV